MALKTYTLKFATLGADLNDFQLTSNGGLVQPPMANRNQLLSGLTVSVDESATVITVTSTGFCTNATAVSLPTSNPPSGGGGATPCAGIASCISAVVGSEFQVEGQNTECRDDFGTLISSGHPIFRKTITFTLQDCNGAPIVASADVPISIRLSETACGGSGNIYVSTTIFAGQSQATYSFVSAETDNGGDYARCGCYTTTRNFVSATSPNFPNC